MTAVIRIALLFVVVLLGACGPGASSSTPVPSTATVVAGDVIVLKTTGSIAGVDRELRIGGSGLARLYEKGVEVAVRQMTPTSFAQIQDFLQEGDFFNLEERYDKGGVSDDIYYELIYTKGGRSKSVIAAEVGGQGLTPKRVLDVIAKLTQFEWQMSYKRQP